MYIFNELNEVNFESVVKFLEHYKNVSDNVFNVTTEAALELSTHIKEGLINAISEIHPDYDASLEERLERARETFRNSKSIFTTNYDLLLYWICLIDNTSSPCHNMKDLLWNSFQYGEDVNGLWDNDIGIYYLHGGLHIFPSSFSGVEKISTGSRHTLCEEIQNKIQNDHLPLFITEGTSENKLQMISSNNYLSHCFRELVKCPDQLVVHGHSLNLEFDEHIVKAIGKSYHKHNKSKIYISVFDFENRQDVLGSYAVSIREAIKSYFPQSTEFIFYNATTHPLAT